MSYMLDVFYNVLSHHLS